jgi:site-specific recombinase XerD
MTETALVRPFDLAPVKKLVLDAVASPITRALYAKALDDFFAWWDGQGRPAFSRAAVHAYRVALEAKGYAPSTVNQRLAAIKKLAREAAAHGWLSSEAAIGITQVAGARQQGTRAGNWLTRAQAEQLINSPDPATLQGRRDRVILALLVGCGLRRAEATNLTLDRIQQRDGRWVLVDLQGKHGRIRTVPVPAWVKQSIDLWTEAAGIADGRLLRSLNSSRGDMGNSLSPQAVFAVVSQYGSRLQLRDAGAELEQIQLLLGHASIQTTERYLGIKQDLVHAPNDRIGVRWHG